MNKNLIWILLLFGGAYYMLKRKGWRESYEFQTPLPGQLELPPVIEGEWEPAAGWATPARGQKYQSAFTAAELKYNLPHNLLSRMAMQESNYNPVAESPAGAKGLMQIIPRWHPDVDVFDPFDSIDYAGKYMRENYNRFGSWEKALAAYNYGPTATQKLINRYAINWRIYLPRETQQYINNIGSDITLQ